MVPLRPLLLFQRPRPSPFLSPTLPYVKKFTLERVVLNTLDVGSIRKGLGTRLLVFELEPFILPLARPDVTPLRRIVLTPDWPPMGRFPATIRA